MMSYKCQTWIFQLDHCPCFVSSTLWTLLIKTVAVLCYSAVQLHSLETTFSIRENQPIGTRVGVLTEVIETFRYKAGVHFHLQQIDSAARIVDLGSTHQKPQQQSQQPLFSIDKYSGVITTNTEKLDRELICPAVSGLNLQCSVALVVSVVEYIINVKIVILDVNDNAPVFLKKQKLVKIAENEPIGYIIELEQAIDLDSAQFGIQSYQLLPLQPALPLRLLYNKSLLRLKLTSSVDFETNQRFDLLIKVCDSGKLCSTQSLLVEIIDVNDVTPTFQQQNYSIVVKETLKVGSKITTVIASDREQGDFGRVKYRLGDTNEYGARFVRLDENSGAVYLVQSLIGVRRFDVTVEARDNGPVPKFAWTKLSVLVIDINIHAPQLKVTAAGDVETRQHSPEHWVIAVPENRRSGQILVFVKVKDLDQGPNGELQCIFGRLQPSSRPPEVQLIELRSKADHSQIYKLVTDVTFDREDPLYEVMKYSLVCRDKGVPALSSSLLISLEIADHNEYPSHFSQQIYEAELIEEKASEEVLSFELVDADATAKNHFSLQGIYSDYFIVTTSDSLHGKLLSISPIDREKIEKIDIVIVVVNLGFGGSKNFTSSASVLIRVLDVNDNYPSLAGRSQFEIMENSGNNTVLGRCSVRDRDVGENGRVTLKFVRSFCAPVSLDNRTPVDYDFKVEQSSWDIRSVKPLDYEKM